MRTRALSRFVALSLALASAAVLNSCVGDGTTLDPSGQPLPPPRITVTPDTLAVSVVEETTQWYEITITNDGGLPLRVTGVRSTEEFLGTDFDDPVEIAGGDTLPGPPAGGKSKSRSQST